MKRVVMVLMCLISLFFYVGTYAHASTQATQIKSESQKVTSAFGFDIEVPDSWLVLTGDKIRDKSISVEKLEDSGIDKEATVGVFQRVLSEKSEMYFIPPAKGSNRISSDNINVINSLGTIAKKETLKALCDATEEQLTAVFGKPTALDSCEYRYIGQVASIYIEFDGLQEGVKNGQYHSYDINNGIKDIYIVFSITALKDNFKKIHDDLTASLKTIRWHQ